MSQPIRDSNGRFTQGNPGGPGRKPREVEQRFLATMATIVDDEAWESIVKKATLDAAGGDAKARQWISSYMLGMPISRIEEPEGGDPMMEMIERWQAAKAAASQQGEG